ncbi:MAG TPA: hypothetical protein V6D27_10525 [Vampirovibrionales bacterium]
MRPNSGETRCDRGFFLQAIPIVHSQKFNVLKEPADPPAKPFPITDIPISTTNISLKTQS